MTRIYWPNGIFHQPHDFPEIWDFPSLALSYLLGWGCVMLRASLTRYFETFLRKIYLSFRCHGWFCSWHLVTWTLNKLLPKGHQIGRSLQVAMQSGPHHLIYKTLSRNWGGYILGIASPLKLPWWGRAPSNCRGTLSFLYKMGGPGWRHLYKMECAKKTLENDRAPTYTGDSWWIEKFEAISIMFGGHMSMYKNKDSFCRHVPGLQNE